MRRPVVAVCALLLLALSLAGCAQGGDHDEHEDGGTETTAADGSGTTSASGTEAGDEHPDGEGEDHEHEQAQFPAAEATDTAKISMRDYAFVDMPATVTGPKLRIEAANNGPSAHEVVVFDADGNEVGGIDAIASGDSANVSLELTAGTYEMRCEIAISETETHLDRGMKAVFAVM